MLLQNIKLVTIFVFFLFIVQIYAGGNELYVSVSSGQFDIIKSYEPSFEGRVELLYYDNEIASPFGGIMANTDGGMFIYAGLFTEFQFFSIMYVQPSFSPGIYMRNGSKNLNYNIQFKSQLELGIILTNDSRIGISFNHISKAGLGPPNPGAESMVFTVTAGIM